MDKPNLVTSTTVTTSTSTHKVTTVEINAEGEVLVARLENARKQIAAYEAEKDAVTKELEALIGDADGATVNGVMRVAVQHVNSTNINRKKMKDLVAPELLEQIIEPNPYSYLKTLKA